MHPMDATAKRRARLATVEQEIARLRARYELAMSAFKFDEANATQREIAGLDAERQSLARSLPPPFVAEEPPTGVVPAIGRPSRRRRARPRR
jgi:hypothetical protein